MLSSLSTPIIFTVMILLMIYAAGTFQLWLFLASWFGGSWLIALIGIEKHMRARPRRAF